MPRAKTDNPTTPAAEAENGFAALEAKVEEIHVEAAIEAELMIEDDAVAAVPVSVVAITEDPTATARQNDPEPQASPPTTMRAPPNGLALPSVGFAEFAAAAVKMQTEALTSLAGARTPFDLVKAQLAYNQRAVALYFDALAQAGAQIGRAIQNLPAPALR